MLHTFYVVLFVVLSIILRMRLPKLPLNLMCWDRADQEQRSTATFVLLHVNPCYTHVYTNLLTLCCLYAASMLAQHSFGALFLVNR